MLLNKSQSFLAVKDLTGRKVWEGPQPISETTAAINVTIAKVASWLPSTSIYILSALFANLKELAQVIDKRSSEDDAIKASQVCKHSDPLVGGISSLASLLLRRFGTSQEL